MSLQGNFFETISIVSKILQTSRHLKEEKFVEKNEFQSSPIYKITR